MESIKYFFITAYISGLSFGVYTWLKYLYKYSKGEYKNQVVAKKRLLAIFKNSVLVVPFKLFFVLPLIVIRLFIIGLFKVVEWLEYRTRFIL